LGVIGALVVLATLLLTVSASSAANGSERKSYIVVMAQMPLLGYDGDVAGIPATKPDAGESVDVTTAAAKEYTQYLTAQHNDSLADAGVSASAKVNEYTVALNGYSALLTEAQAAAVKSRRTCSESWRTSCSSRPPTRAGRSSASRRQAERTRRASPARTSSSA
jgi:hypothetical protein